SSWPGIMTFSFLKSRLFDAIASKDRREERRFLNESARFLVERDLNPERVGCPSSDFLRKLAAHAVTIEELRPWTNHLSECGECYREFHSLKGSSNPVYAGLTQVLRRLTGKRMR